MKKIEGHTLRHVRAIDVGCKSGSEDIEGNLIYIRA